MSRLSAMRSLKPHRILSNSAVKKNDWKSKTQSIRTVIPFQAKSSAASAVAHLNAEVTQAEDIELLGAAPLILQTSKNAL
jgi:formylmethanofuran dehydrogenase subunit B